MEAFYLHIKDFFSTFDQINFEEKDFFFLFLIFIPMIAWYILRKKNSQATIRFSQTEVFTTKSSSIKRYLRHILFVLRLAAISMLILILAKPVTRTNKTQSDTKGIDIVIALDVSSSMLAQDFRPNRLEASKDVAIDFINARDNDEIGLVVFSGESYTQCPLTTDKAAIINLFKEVKQGIIEDGTALGVGLANAVNRLKSSKAISKVVILLTDGVNNMGEISPETAADLAAKYNVRVYTIGVGRNGMAPYPMKDMFGRTVIQDVKVEIDEETLKKISQKTDGKYFRATNNKKLKEIYKEIDKLEKTKIEVKKYSIPHDEYFGFAVFAALFILIEIILRQTIFRNIP